MVHLDTKDQREENVDERLFESLTSCLCTQHMMIEVLMEDTFHDDFDFNN